MKTQGKATKNLIQLWEIHHPCLLGKCPNDKPGLIINGGLLLSIKKKLNSTKSQT